MPDYCFTAIMSFTWAYPIRGGWGYILVAGTDELCFSCTILQSILQKRLVAEAWSSSNVWISIAGWCTCSGSVGRQNAPRHSTWKSFIEFRGKSQSKWITGWKYGELDCGSADATDSKNQSTAIAAQNKWVGHRWRRFARPTEEHGQERTRLGFKVLVLMRNFLVFWNVHFVWLVVSYNAKHFTLDDVAEFCD